jgi:hypothetical protein
MAQITERPPSSATAHLLIHSAASSLRSGSRLGVRADPGLVGWVRVSLLARNALLVSGAGLRGHGKWHANRAQDTRRDSDEDAPSDPAHSVTSLTEDKGHLQAHSYQSAERAVKPASLPRLDGDPPLRTIPAKTGELSPSMCGQVPRFRG